MPEPEPAAVKASLIFALSDLRSAREGLEEVVGHTPLGNAIGNLDATITNVEAALRVVKENDARRPV